jgi:hypothetical protein
VVVSDSETRTAMTTLRFSWGWPKRITRRISSLFKGIRSSRATSSRDYDDDDEAEEDFAVRSSPAITVERRGSARMSSSEMNDKGKRRAVSRSVIMRNDSTPNMGRRREESIERWARDTSKSGNHDSIVSYPHSRWRDPNVSNPLDLYQPCASHPQGRPHGRKNTSTPLPDDAMFLGAGGVCNDPSSLVSSNLPLGLNQSIGNSAVILQHPQPRRLSITAQASAVPGPSSHDSGHSRHPVVRSATQSPSPLHHVAYESDADVITDEDEYEDCDDSDSSFFREPHADRQAESQAFQANTSLMYGEEDEDESDEETVPIEVKRRRPSVSVIAASPVHFSESSDDDAYSR